MSNEEFVFHDPVHRRWAATDVFCEVSALQWFSQCVRDRVFPSMCEDGFVLLKVGEKAVRRFELLRNASFGVDGAPGVRQAIDRVAVGADVLRAH